ncbi:hypothetical protein [Arthrobacter pityocampae]|uniref:hypothetical protein n=1 Tax=Arthrobacter pityocampae TaxID=547334 RepID=UPI003734E806
MPSLDRTAFDVLVEDLDIRTALDFRSTFNASLPQRIGRIHQAVEARDQEEITTALLSLQACAAMAGAAQLQASAADALLHHDAGLTPSKDIAHTLTGQAEAFTTALAAFHQGNGYDHHP